jgi:predicted permease
VPDLPPRAAERLVRWLVGGRDADAVTGDLRESFTARGGGRAWYWRQALSCAAVRISPSRRMLPGLGQDFHYALRTLRRNPGYALTAMLCLALAMGVNATLFSFLDSVYFRRLPVPDADRIVQVMRRGAVFCTWPQFQSLHNQFRAVQAATQLVAAADAELGRVSFNVAVEIVSSNYGQVLRPGTTIGNWFTPADETAGGEPPVVISDRLWKQRLNGSPDIIGKPLRLFDRTYRIAGVAPPAFHGALPPVFQDLWIPASTVISSASPLRVNLVARLAPGATFEQARAELQVVAARLDPNHPVRVYQAKGFLWRNGSKAFMPVIALMSAVCAMVLLIACVNVANLLLSRAAVRQHELALRQSLGASRARLFRETLVEALLLSAGGVILGLIAGYWTGRALEIALPSVPVEMYQGLRFAVDWRVALLLGAAGIAGAILFSLPQAFAAGRTGLNAALKGEGSSARSRQREFYTVAQVALSLTLLIATALLLRALLRVQDIGPGFATDHRLYVSVWASKDTPPEETQHTLTSLLERARAIPGVQDATLASEVFGSGNLCAAASALAKPDPIGGNVVEPNYFDMMRIPILQGRTFLSVGSLNDQPEVIVNETMARRWWPNSDALGKPLWAGCRARDRRIGQVVGVARDVADGSFGDAPDPLFYLSRLQDPGNGHFGLVIRTAGNPYLWAKPLLEVAQSGGPRLRVFEVQSLDDTVGKSLWEVKWQAGVLGAIGLLAIVLAAIGVYGVVAHSVSQRTREIGVRMAVGAAPADVHWMVLAQGLRLTAMGIAAGLLLSAAAVRLLRGFLYGLSPFDPLAFATASLAWIAIAMLASWFPARRATRVDPLAALKYE